jgi:Zn ribbon nucleic-acid-binding protein
VVNRFFPSTQLCPQCNTKNKLSQWERTYSCKCGYTEDRDLKSAQCILNEGLKNLVPTECREVKPREIETSVFTMFSNLENIVSVSFCQNSQYLIEKDLGSLNALA